MVSMTLALSLRGQLLMGGALSAYAAAEKDPELVLDFESSYFRVGWATSTFANAITHTRASTATYVDSTGTLQTAAINEPRLGHHVYNGTAWVNEGLLHESEARTNLALGSNTPSNTTYWTATATQSGITHTVVGTGVENGAAYIDVRYAGTATNTFQSSLYQTNLTRTAASTVQTYVASLTGRIISGTGPSTRGIHTGIAGEVAPSSFVNLVISTNSGSLSEIETSTDQTIFARYTVSGSVNQVRAFIGLTFVSGETIDVTYRLKLFQFELGQMPSSFIPTAGTTVTRSADVLTIPAANLPYPEPVVIGPELVTNGTFDNGITGWSVAFGAPLTVVNGALRVEDDGVDGASARAFQGIPTQVGKVYRATADLVGRNIALNAMLVASTNTNLGGFPQQPVSSGTAEVIFVAQATTTNIMVTVNSTAAGAYADWDNISVREINPLALSIQMDGRVTYADENTSTTHIFYEWRADVNNRIQGRLDTNTGTGKVLFLQVDNSVLDFVQSGDNVYAPDVLVPFNISSRHGSTFVNGATDGTALTANTTPTALADLPAANLTLASDYNGTIRTFRVWGQDIADTGLVEATT